MLKLYTKNENLHIGLLCIFNYDKKRKRFLYGFNKNSVYCVFQSLYSKNKKL